MTTTERYYKALGNPHVTGPMVGEWERDRLATLRECRDLMRERLAKIDSWVYPMANVGHIKNRYWIVVRGRDRFGIHGFDMAQLYLWKLVQKEA